MPFPAGWPPRAPTGVRNIRFFATGTATTDFSDNGLLFIDGTGANPFTPLPVVPVGGGGGPSVVPPLPAGTGESRPNEVKAMIWSETILIENVGAAAIEFSFDGTNVHGTIAAASTREMMRHESGIALRTTAGTSAFRVEAW